MNKMLLFYSERPNADSSDVSATAEATPQNWAGLGMT